MPPTIHMPNVFMPNVSQIDQIQVPLIDRGEGDYVSFSPIVSSIDHWQCSGADGSGRCLIVRSDWRRLGRIRDEGVKKFALIFMWQPASVSWTLVGMRKVPRATRHTGFNYGVVSLPAWRHRGSARKEWCPSVAGITLNCQTICASFLLLLLLPPSVRRVIYDRYRFLFRFPSMPSTKATATTVASDQKKSQVE